MSSKLTVSYIFPDRDTEILKAQLKSADNAYESLLSGRFDMNGWVDYPANIPEELYNRIENMAKEVADRFSAVVVIGVGGSYIGTHAALDFISKKNNEKMPKLFFAGINLSMDYHEEIMQALAHEDPALLIISKSGGTTEICQATKLFTAYLEDRYGKCGTQGRIYVVTDSERGNLRKIADDRGYPSLSVPGDIGGRFSFLTPVGLFPMSIAGFNIREIVRGAMSAGNDELIKAAQTLAAVRNMFESRGYVVELFAGFDPYLTNLIQWLKQLYGESEGKDGKGMLPVSLEYSKDLHSLGQFVQDGRQFFTETIVSVKEDGQDKGVGMTGLNQIAKEGVIAAHSSAGIPIVQIEIPARDEYSLGQAIHFLEMSCAVRGIMMGVNPFDQPGVEKYKDEMKKLQNISEIKI